MKFLHVQAERKALIVQYAGNPSTLWRMFPMSYGVATQCAKTASLVFTGQLSSFRPFLSSCLCSSHAPGATCCLSVWFTRATSGSHARTTFCSGWSRAWTVREQNSIPLITTSIIPHGILVLAQVPVINTEEMLLYDQRALLPEIQASSITFSTLTTLVLLCKSFWCASCSWQPSFRSW